MNFTNFYMRRQTSSYFHLNSGSCHVISYTRCLTVLGRKTLARSGAPFKIDTSFHFSRILLPLLLLFPATFSPFLLPFLFRLNFHIYTPMQLPIPSPSTQSYSCSGMRTRRASLHEVQKIREDPSRPEQIREDSSRPEQIREDPNRVEEPSRSSTLSRLC